VKNRIIKTTLLLLAVFLLAACNNQYMYEPETADYSLIEDYVSYEEYTADENYADEEYIEERQITEDEYAQGYKIEPLEPITFTTTMRIHIDMPEFTFHRTLGDLLIPVPTPEFFLYTKREVTITIFDENDNLIQEIDGLIQRSLEPSHDPEGFNIGFDDFNFDGYLDMVLITAVWPGRVGNIDKSFWLWDSEIGQFVRNPQLSGIAFYGLGVNHETRQITTSQRLDHAQILRHYFEYNNGVFELVARAEMYFTFDNEQAHRYRRITRTDIKTDEVTVEIVPTNPNGSDIITPADVTFVESIEQPGFNVPLLVQMDAWRQNEHKRTLGRNEYEVNITVWTYGGRLVQQITGITANFNLSRPNWFDDYNNPFNFHLLDYNGDGYLDMGLRVGTGGSQMGDPHHFWLWNAESRQFVRSPELERISDGGSIWLTDDGYIRSWSRLSFSDRSTRTFAFINGELTLIQTELVEHVYDLEESRGRMRTTVTDYINNTETITFEEININPR